MATIIVRNLPEETHRALKTRAAAHRRSAEAEVREILEQAVRPARRARIGSELAAFGHRAGGLELKIRRDRTPAAEAEFE
ncbi:MAG TPA: antitoxin [Acidobacteriaceae bacterium]|nr:antitoxin [Acidobacteriaceae bacterium]